MGQSETSQRLRLLLLGKSPRSAKEICQQLEISQPVFSRALATLKAEILISGRARATRYALRREIPGVGSSIPLFRVDAEGVVAHFANLQAIHPKGFFLEVNAEKSQGQFFEDLPYLLDDLRPAGFLGRLVPKAHPVVGYPQDIRNWNSDHCLHYFTNFGWNLIGDLILGEPALEIFLKRSQGQAIQNSPIISERDRPFAYPKLASEVLTFGDAGSSAGGEQPKFLVVGKKAETLTHLLVKFSPRQQGALAQRRADLLVCEHIAHQTLSRFGKAAAQSEILQSDSTTFLEVQRFDRIGINGRKGIISLAALDAQFVGSVGTWKAASQQLLVRGTVDEATHQEICWLELFGRSIGNTDMHLWNISFFTEDNKVTALTPVYDMLPMLYAPQHEQLIERQLEPPVESPLYGAIFKEVTEAAAAFWRAVSVDQRISAEFREIARKNITPL